MLPNRSFQGLPAVYTEAQVNWAGWEARPPVPLEVYDITYLHFHSVMELGLCMSGQGVCMVEGVEYLFRAGDVQLIFPFQRHLSKRMGEGESLWYWMNIDPLRALSAWGMRDIRQVENWLQGEMGLCGIITPEAHPEIARLIRRLIEVQYSAVPPPPHRGEYLCASLYALLLELCDASQALPKLSLRPNARFVKLLPALEHIQAVLEEGCLPPLPQLASLCRVSDASFRRLFHQAVGLSPRAYLQACQVRRAQALLLMTEDSVLDIALSVGFEDASGLHRRFLRHTNMTPAAYRRRLRGE